MPFFRRLLPALIALLLSGCYSLAADITPPPGYVYTTPVPSAVPTEVMYFPFMPPNPAEGRAIYTEKCEPCHGPGGLGNGPRAAELPNPVAAIGDPNLSRSRTPEDWFRQVTEGNLERYMPPFNSLTDRERWDVVAYAFSLSTTAEQIEGGRTLYQENCAACHGLSGAGDGPDAAGLAADPGSLISLAVLAERSANDIVVGLTHPDAPDLPHFDDLSAQQMAAVSDFVRTLTFKSAAVAAEPEMPAASSPAPTEIAAVEPGSPDEPAAADTASVSGQVLNLAAEASAEVQVVLYGFDQFQQVMTRTAAIEPDGSFLFETVPMPEGRAFLVAVDYGRSTYTSDLAVAGPVPQDLSLLVTVFDSTADTSQVSVDRLHVFFEFLSSDTIRVAELILLTNPTDRLIIAERQGDPTVVFSLPAGAQNIQFEESAGASQFVRLEGGFGDLRGIQPGVGSHQILVSFDMPFSRNFELNQVIDFPVNALVVLLPETGVKLTDSSLRFEGTRDIEGRTYELYTGGGLAAGAPLPISLSGSPDMGGSLSVGSRSGLAIGMTAVGAVLVGAGVFLYRRSRPRFPVLEDLEEDEPLPEHVAGMTEDELMDAIIALDDRYRAGDLPEGAYLKQRGMLKRRLQDQLSV